MKLVSNIYLTVSATQTPFIADHNSNPHIEYYKIPTYQPYHCLLLLQEINNQNWQNFGHPIFQGISKYTQITTIYISHKD